MDLNFDKMKPNEIKAYLNGNLMECFTRMEEVRQSLVMDKRVTVKRIWDYILKEENLYKKKSAHFKSMIDFDASFGSVVAGVDEVGRGPLAGPIVAACVILDPNKINDCLLDIDDSKKLTSEKRKSLVPYIKECALSYSISYHSNEDIDTLGLSFCNNNIFLKALEEIKIKPQVVLSDGFYIKNSPVRNERVIKGDAKSAAIACASILAKEYRDDLMKSFDEIFPGYGFKSNVGYGSKEHIEAIVKFGITKIHRKSFVEGILSREKSSNIEVNNVREKIDEDLNIKELE